jgi:hypothetical protein
MYFKHSQTQGTLLITNQSLLPRIEWYVHMCMWYVHTSICTYVCTYICTYVYWYIHSYVDFGWENLDWAKPAKLARFSACFPNLNNHRWQNQGCQIFLRQHTKMGKNIPNNQIIPILTKWPQNIPNGHKIYQHLIFQDHQTIDLVCKYAIWQPWAELVIDYTWMYIRTASTVKTAESSSKRAIDFI